MDQNRARIDILKQQALGHLQRNALTDARSLYVKICELDACDAQAWFMRGITNALLGSPSEAEYCYRHALSLQKEFPEAYCNLATLLWEQGRLDESINNARQAITCAPGLAEAHNILAQSLRDTDQLDEAVASYRRALSLKPEFAEAHNNLGIALQRMGDLDGACEHYRHAIRINPGYLEPLTSMGLALQAMGKPDEALTMYETALQYRPDYPEANWNRSLTYLATGNFSRGWEGYEWRWRIEANYWKPRILPCPQWQGEPLAGKTILVHMEQGIGDQIMFASCLPDIVKMAGKVLIECDARLVNLLSRSFHGTTAFPRDSSLPNDSIDFTMPAGSLPRLLRPDLSAFPKHGGYLVADPALREKWSHRFRQLGEGLNIGISWRGGSDSLTRRLRSIDLAGWKDVVALPGVKMIDLQYGEHEAELQAAMEQFGMRIHAWQDMDPLTDLDDLAAQVSALDLVVSADNSTVHMGGALGIPVCALLPYSADWRWGQQQTSSYWYPSVRLFRQTSPGNWKPVLDSVVAHIRQA